MANTVTFGSGVINIVPDGSADFDIKTYWPSGMRLTGTYFVTSAAADLLIIRDGSATGAKIVPNAALGLEAADFDNLDCFPYIKASECTFTTPANCLIILYFV